MGLDSVELVIAFEEAFGLEIPDADAEKMFTPRSVIDFVEQRLGSGSKPPCLSRRAFQKIRGQLMEVGITRAAIRPDTPLANLFPQTTRRLRWPQARGLFSRTQWPDLCRSPRTMNTIFAVTSIMASLVVCSTLIATSGRKIFVSFALAILAAIVVGIALIRVTRSLCICFPGIVTVRDLAVHVTAAASTSLLREGERLSREQIAETVKRIVIEQLGLADAKYGEDKDFIRDLGMN